MKAPTEHDIRASFINCSKGEAKRLPVPHDLAGQQWPDLDFLGWTDQRAPQRRYLVTERDGEFVGIALRFAPGNRTKTTMCDICLTVHTGGGVAMMVAAKAGASGRVGNTVGIYLCADLDCSAYIRGTRVPTLGERIKETLPAAELAERLRSKLFRFLDRVQS